MKKLFLSVMVAMICAVLVIPAMAGKIVVKQSQSQGVVQGQASLGGPSVSTQAYATGANQGYVIQKTGNPSGVAAGWNHARLGW